MIGLTVTAMVSIISLFFTTRPEIYVICDFPESNTERLYHINCFVPICNSRKMRFQETPIYETPSINLPVGHITEVGLLKNSVIFMKFSI